MSFPFFKRVLFQKTYNYVSLPRNLIKPKIEIDLFSNKTFPVNKEVNSLVDYFLPSYANYKGYVSNWEDCVEIIPTTQTITLGDYKLAIEFAQDAWLRWPALKVHSINFNKDFKYISNIDSTISQILNFLIELENDKDKIPTATATINYLKEDIFFRIFLDFYEECIEKYGHVPSDTLVQVTKPKEKDVAPVTKNNNPDDLTKYAPHVIRYEEHHISNNDLICKADNLRKNTFFNGVLKIMGSDISELETTYQKFKDLDYWAVLTSEAKRLTNKLEKITKYFNDLYCLENDKYKF